MHHSETEHNAVAKTLSHELQPLMGRWLFMDCVIACGDDHAAGSVLHQLLYWWPKKRPDQNGVKKSVPEWKAECRVSKDQINRINKKLINLKLVEIHQGPWGHFKSPSNFYVLTEKALALLKPYAGNPLMVSATQAENTPTPQEGKSPMVDIPQAGNPAVTENTKDTENTKTNTKSASALPDAMLTGEKKQKHQGESKAKAHGVDLKISVDFEALFKQEFPKVFVPLTKTDREILGGCLHALHDAGEEDYEGCLLFVATATGHSAFQGLCNAAGVFPHLKSFPESKRIRENLPYLRQAYHSHLDREAKKVVQAKALAAKKAAAPVVKPAPVQQPKLTAAEQAEQIADLEATMKAMGVPFGSEIPAKYSWQAAKTKPAPVPSDQATTAPDESAPCADAPEPGQAATAPPIEPTPEPVECPQVVQVNTFDYEEMFDTAEPPLFDGAAWKADHDARFEAAVKKARSEYAESHGVPMPKYYEKELRKTLCVEY